MRLITKEFRYLKSNLVCVTLLLTHSLLSILYPYFIQRLIDDGIGRADGGRIIIYTVMMVTVIALSIFIGYGMRMKFVKLGQRITLDIKERIVNCFEGYTLEFFERHKIGDMVSVLENDVRNVQTLYAYLFSDFLSNLLVFIGISIIMLQIDWRITLVIIGVTFLFSMYQRRFGVVLKQHSKKLSLSRGEMQSFEQDYLSNYYEIKNLNSTRFFNDRFLEKQKDIFSLEKSMARVRAGSGQSGFLFQNMCMIIALLYGSFGVMNGKITVGALFSMIIYIQKLYAPIISMFQLYMDIKKTQASVSRVHALLDEADCCTVFGKQEFPKEFKGVQIANLTFGYGEHKIFEGFGYQISAGDKIAILGMNGKGKTTLIKMLLRSLNKFEGELKIDSMNIADISEQEYRKHVIGLSQKVTIFSGTVYENVTLFNKEIPEERVKEALDMVGMPLELHTPLGNQGIILSGGQSQKIHIARLFVSEPDIIILDEPTSALDMDSEVLIYENLFSHFKDKTIIVISHRQEVLKYCNKVINLDEIGEAV